MVHWVSIADVLWPMRFPRGQVARNHVWLAPLTNVQSEADGTLSEAEERWLLRRADGGFGVVETCAAYVAADGKSWRGQIGVDRDAVVPRLARLAKGLRDRGAMGIVQLFHGGARAPSEVSGCEPWTASLTVGGSGGLESARVGTADDIAATIAAFRAAALRVATAGFDGVEVHGAHSYLLSQFLSTSLNRRDDAFGGTLENRARLIRSVVQEIRKALPPPFLLGVRISPENYGHVTGLDLDESAEVCRWLAEDGVDFLHASLWDHRQMSRKYPDRNPYSVLRAAVPEAIPLVAAGQFWAPEEVANWFDGSGPIALGRAAILNPDWPKHAAQPGWLPRRPPFSPDELAGVEVSPKFVEYLKRWKGFVTS